MTPILTMGPIATTDDERIANVLLAIRHETGDTAEIARWALENWQNTRAALVAIREAVEAAQNGADVAIDSDELIEIVGDGLEVAES